MTPSVMDGLALFGCVVLWSSSMRLLLYASSLGRPDARGESDTGARVCPGEGPVGPAHPAPISPARGPARVSPRGGPSAAGAGPGLPA